MDCDFTVILLDVLWLYKYYNYLLYLVYQVNMYGIVKHCNSSKVL